MPQKPIEKESKSIKISEIKAEIETFMEELEFCQNRTKTLMASEDPSKKIYFAREIFASQQDKLRLEVEIDTRRKKINRIKQGLEWY